MNLLGLSDPVGIGVGVSIEKERIVLLLALALHPRYPLRAGLHSSDSWAHCQSAGRPAESDVHSDCRIDRGLVLALADTIGRNIVDPDGIAAGIMVAIIGAPYFVYSC